MQIYRVGGSVRDELLGLPVKDRDWVVVGATPEAMVEQGFRPVGRDFPVFLHPRTNEEYALARTERKVARGYRGFAVHCSPEVTLEDDLQRRDLTINAMARDPSGALIDPWGGRDDLEAGRLRHVSDAFAEDPVRILRLARFAARFADFSVAPETRALMQAMVASGEADALVAERVWQELAKGLCERAPARMFEILIDCGALARILPELDREWSALDRAALLGACAAHQLGLDERYASLCFQHTAPPDGPALDQACSDRLRVPAHCREFGRLVNEAWPVLRDWTAFTADQRLSGLERFDALRRPERAQSLVRWARTIGPLIESLDWHNLTDAFSRDQAAARSVDAGAIARSCLLEAPRGPSVPESTRIAQAVRAARIAALTTAPEDRLRAGRPGSASSLHPPCMER